jgi:hypothetical protein
VRGRFSLCLLRTRSSFVRDLLLVGFVAFDEKPAYPGDDQHPITTQSARDINKAHIIPITIARKTAAIAMADTELPWGVHVEAVLSRATSFREV